MNTSPTPSSSIRERVMASASRLGVELNEAELERWVNTVTTTDGDDRVVTDERTGIFGHRLSMLDFDPQQLARFRAIGRIVEFEDVPGQVETALALSGSAAQSKIQTYPGDCDFFERVNVIAPTRAAACDLWARVLSDKAIKSMSGPNYQLIELRFGNYPQDVMRGGRACRKGSSITWSPDDVTAGRIEATDFQGQPVVIAWEAAAQDPGWCKLDWVIADPARNQLANASNMVDVTWEGPDGRITPLDGYLDGYFQEVYLEAGSAPIFDKLVKQVSADSLEQYIAQLQGEVKKYFGGSQPNYGKAAKRLYNIFRLSGRYEEAAFLRELFDEPAALLYQVYALMRTVQEAVEMSDVFSRESILDQTDDLIMAVVKVLEGEEELEIVRHLLRLYRNLARWQEGVPLGEHVNAAQAEVLHIVNNFFYEKMTAMPTIKAYVTEMHQ